MLSVSSPNIIDSVPRKRDSEPHCRLRGLRRLRGWRGLLGILGSVPLALSPTNSAVATVGGLLPVYPNNQTNSVSALHFAKVHKSKAAF